MLEDLLNAVYRGILVREAQTLKICPHCWSPGTEADPIGLDSRSQYCFKCGTPLRGKRSRSVSLGDNYAVGLSL